MADDPNLLGNLNTADKHAFDLDPIETDKTNRRVVIVGVLNDALPWTKYEVIIPASATTVIDTNLLSSFSRIDYIINFKDSPITVTKSMKVVVQNNAGTITDHISERMGGPISISIDNTDDSIDQFLEVTNSETFPLTVTFLKAKV